MEMGGYDYNQRKYVLDVLDILSLDEGDNSELSSFKTRSYLDLKRFIEREPCLFIGILRDVRRGDFVITRQAKEENKEGVAL